ncbi:hypothetical protein [Pimelobacter simplex]|uniref:hypothetical protein n=1 Tax=Nocardioides simplex TaxID=2045 RepID=UPI00214F8CC5|nr:hypothetical protein [Pimelobacter simplex]UUW88371.1 hypothetical protein M0M43_21865 [Pimelobacter simplex]UUW97875.1 hypothetical protein M0M48_10510 [Pimelobacter simplex]
MSARHDGAVGDARKRAAGIAASNPTAPEPTGTLEGAPGADSEALAARDADIDQLCEIFHDAYEAEALSAGWETNPRSRVPWGDVPEPNKQCMRAAVRAFLGSGRFADHDHQIAERAWDEGYGSGHSNAMRRMSDEPNAPTTPNPYSEEAHRG